MVENSAQEKKKEVGFYQAPPPESGWESVKKFIYNPEEGKILGRTPVSWYEAFDLKKYFLPKLSHRSYFRDNDDIPAKIGLFYLIFYLVLASLFGIMLWIFYHTLDPRVPRWQLTESLIGKDPGLGFRPMPNDTDMRSTLIWYQGKSRQSCQLWTKTLENFLEVYRKPGLTPGRGQNIYNCDYDRPPGKGQVCDVDVKGWYPCTVENNFSYHLSSPCVFIKLNKIYGWQPEFYNDSREFPENMPEDLKNHILTQKAINPELVKTVWVTCDGEGPADREHIGEIQYIPRQGFPGFFYPYVNTEGYLSPLVAVHFKRPRTGVIISVECRAWAKNVHADRKEKIGTVHFELLVD